MGTTPILETPAIIIPNKILELLWGDGFSRWMTGTVVRPTRMSNLPPQGPSKHPWWWPCWPHFEIHSPPGGHLFSTGEITWLQVGLQGAMNFISHPCWWQPEIRFSLTSWGWEVGSYFIPFFLRVLYISGGWDGDFWTINSMRVLLLSLCTTRHWCGKEKYNFTDRHRHLEAGPSETTLSFQSGRTKWMGVKRKKQIAR